MYRSNQISIYKGKSIAEAPQASWWKRLFRGKKRRRVHDRSSSINRYFVILYCECLVCWKRRGFKRGLLELRSHGDPPLPTIQSK